MNNPDILQLLVVAAEPGAANRLLGDLRHEGGGANLRAVAGLEELGQALDEAPRDALVCFDGDGDGAPAAQAVLALLGERGHPLPCIVALATRDGDSVTLMRRGAADALPAAQRERLALRVRREAETQALRRRARRLEVSLRELEKRHRVLLDGTREAFAYVREGIHLYCNPGYAGFFGYADSAAIRSTPLLDLVTEASRDALTKLLDAPSEGETRTTLEGLHKNGSLVAMELCCTPVELDGATCLQAAVRHAPGNSDYASQVAEIETRDLLTRLHNRTHFLRRLEHAIGVAVRQGRNGALLLVRLNEFLDIESTVGRTGANLILADIGRFLLQSAHKPFSAARLSAHEFGLLLPEARAEEALKLAGFIRGKINNRITQAALPSLELSCSVGIALVNANALDAEGLLAAARDNLGTAPGTRDEHALGVDDAPAPGVNGLLDYVGQALARERLKLLFQPVVPLKGGDFRAYDVLARMLDTDGNEIAPAVFIPLLKLHGLGERFDRAVVLRALQALQGADDQSVLVTKLTSTSLASRTFLPWLSEALDERRSPSHRLAFQISETELHRDPTRVGAFCQGLEELNLARVVTHFGCALDPCRPLRAIRPSCVILDESLLRDLSYSKQQQRNVQNLVDDLHRQGYLAGAPRVEDMDLLPMLWDIGVDVVQGYCLQAPSQDMNYEFTQEQEITLGAVPSQ